MSSGDFSNLVIRRATAYNPDGSFIKDGYIFTVGSNGKQSWTSDLKLNNLVLSTVTLNSQLYVSSSIFDRTAVSTLAVSTLSASSITTSTVVVTDIITCTLTASTLLFPSVTFESIGASSMNSRVFVASDATISTARATNLSATNFSFLTLVGSTLVGNAVTVQSTLSGSTISTTNMGFMSGVGSTLSTNSLTTNSLTALSTILGSSLTVSTLTTGSMISGVIQGNTLTINTANVQSTLNASTVLMTSAAYSTLSGSTFSANAIVIQSTLLGSTVNVMNIGYSTMVGSTLSVNTVIVRSTIAGSTVNVVNIGYSTLQGSTLTMNTGVWNSTLIGSTLNMINATYSTLAGSTLNVNTVVWNSTLIGSTLNAIYVTYSTIQGSTLIANNITVQSTLTASTVNAVNIGCSTFSANTVVIQSTLVVSSISGSTLLLSTMNAANITTGSIGFSTLAGSSMVSNMLTVGSTVTTSSLNAVNMSYSTLQGGAIQSQSMIASTLSGSTINFANLTFSTLLASTMTANVMFPLSLQGSTMNVSNLLTATNVGIGTTVANYPLTVSHTAFGAMELNRISTTTSFYGAGTVYTVTDPANNNFKGKYAYAFGGAKTLAIASQSQADGYYAIDVANSGTFGSDTTGTATGAMFYMDSIKTYFQNTALGVGTTSPSWPLTVAKDMSFAAMMSNPLDAALVIKGQTNTGVLKIGTYFTGLSFGAAIQSSQFVTGNDTPSALILNPLGGNVGIGTNSASSKLLVVGSGSATTLTINNNNVSYSNTFSLMMTNNQAIPSQLGFVQKATTAGAYHALTQTGDHLLISKDVSAGVTGANGIVIASQDQTAGLRIGSASSAFSGNLYVTGNVGVNLTDLPHRFVPFFHITLPSIVTTSVWPAQMAVAGNPNAQLLLKLGAYYTSGVGSYCAIQSTETISNVESPQALVLQPIGGYVGIGKTNPTYTLDVVGNVRVTGLITSGSTNIIPYGIIVMWYGSVVTIPSGWYLCNGANGTPDLRDRFVTGAGYSYSPGNTGGVNEVTLTAGQMPYHNHSASDSGHSHVYETYARNTGNNADNGGAISAKDNPLQRDYNTYTGYANISIGYAGGNQAHENRPPYYALCYIMKS